MIATMNQVIRDTRAADLRHNTPACSNAAELEALATRGGARARETETAQGTEFPE